MSDPEIKEVFIQNIPIGSDESTVRELLRNKFHQKLFGIVKPINEDTLNSYLNNPDSFKNEKVGDYFLHTDMASYGWAKNFFFSGHIVSAVWHFGKDKKLKNIRISRWQDGV